MTTDTMLRAVCTAALIGFPAWAQAQTTDTDVVVLTDAELLEVDRAAETMMGRVNAREVPTYMTPTEVAAMLQERGYTNITEFDVEWNHYEVEAFTPTGEEVEIEVDPVTGRILDVEENWF